MIRRSLLTVLMAAALTACAPAVAAAPAINPTDIGATALALANSMLTETPQFGGLSAPPYIGATGAPVPVTGPSGELTTGTPVPVTGLSGAPTTGTPGPVDCNHPLNVSAAGRGIRLAIKNSSSGDVSLLLGIGNPNSQGQCGWISFSIPKKSKTVAQVPESRPDLGDWCYWATAAISSKSSQTIVSRKDICMIAGWHWVLNVTDSGIAVEAP